MVDPSVLGVGVDLSVKTPWQLLRVVVQENADAPERVAAGIWRGRDANPSSEL
jgi:hypothetical protein